MYEGIHERRNFLPMFKLYHISCTVSKLNGQVLSGLHLFSPYGYFTVTCTIHSQSEIIRQQHLLLQTLRQR